MHIARQPPQRNAEPSGKHHHRTRDQQDRACDDKQTSPGQTYRTETVTPGCVKALPNRN